MQPQLGVRVVQILTDVVDAPGIGQMRMGKTRIFRRIAKSILKPKADLGDARILEDMSSKRGSTRTAAETFRTAPRKDDQGAG